MASRLDPLGFYPWHWKRWRLSRRVQRLNYIAEGLCRTLLDEQWAEGFIPDDITELALICRCPTAVMEEHWPDLQQFFPLVATGQRQNANQEENRTEMDRKRIQQSMAGKASAAARAARSSERLSNERSTDVQPEENRREQNSREEKRGVGVGVGEEVGSEPYGPSLAARRTANLSMGDFDNIFTNEEVEAMTARFVQGGCVR